MQDYDALRVRVEETARRMKEAQARRSQGNQSLVDVLGSLETKFKAQEEELAFYKARVGPLETANSRLAELIGRLLDMVDSGFGEDSLEHMRRATAMASAMLDKDMASLPARERPADAPGRYEDVEPERLAADAAAAEDDLDALPEFVRRALVERQSEGFRDAVARIHVTETEDEPAEIERIAADDGADGNAGKIETGGRPAAAPKPRRAKSSIRAVDALATALDQKSASGEPLEANDIKALLERVEALANQSADDDDDDIDIPPARDEDRHGAQSHRRGTNDKTGTDG